MNNGFLELYIATCHVQVFGNLCWPAAPHPKQKIRKLVRKVINSWTILTLVAIKCLAFASTTTFWTHNTEVDVALNQRSVCLCVFSCSKPHDIQLI